MSDIPTLTAMVGETQGEMQSLARSMAAIMADPLSRSADRRVPTMGRRMGVVSAVNVIPSLPLTADVTVNNTTIPGCSPQSTYRPMVGDLVWLEFLGPDPHISPPLTTNANRKWNTLTLNSPWVPYGLTTTAPAYWRDPVGFVHIEGALKNGAGGSIFTNLPAGNRPIADRVFSSPYSDGVTFNVAPVVVRSNGNMEWLGPSSPAAVYLDGFNFRID